MINDHDAQAAYHLLRSGCQIHRPASYQICQMVSRWDCGGGQIDDGGGGEMMMTKLMVVVVVK